ASTTLLLTSSLLAGWLIAIEDRLVYFPSATLVATPEDYGLTYERITLHTEDGLALMGWTIPREGSERWLIYFHGNGENVSRYLTLMAELHALGLNLLIFDYRGYGESEGIPSEAGLYEDAKASYAYLRERGVAAENIYLYGFSLGSGVATELATHADIAGLIIEAGYTSLPEAGRHSYPFAPTFLMRNLYDSLSKIAKVGAPVLFLHSPADKTVPFSQGQRLFESAKEPKALVEVNGGHIAMLRSPPDPRGLEAITDFFNLNP
nr:alpha/beta hydrolase [Deinococcota bacterium]